MDVKKIGLILGISFILIIVCVIYIKSIYKNEPNEAQIQDFIHNSSKHIIENAGFISKESVVYSHPFGLYTKVKKKKVCIVRSPQDNKYYALEYYSKGLGISKMNVEGKNIFLIINNSDYKNTKYGSKENPIPVLKYYTNDNLKDQFVSPESYNYAVKQYIAFCKE